MNASAMQSRTWLLESLLRLMETRDFRAITIRELTADADLDRKTFYRHFRSKEEILLWHMETVCGQYLERLQNLTELTPYTVSLTYFLVCTEHLSFFQILSKHDLLIFMLSRFDYHLSELNEIFSRHPEYRRKAAYELFYQSGGFWNVTLHWIAGGGGESAEEMARIVSAIMPPVTGSI